MSKWDQYAVPSDSPDTPGQSGQEAVQQATQDAPATPPNDFTTGVGNVLSSAASSFIPAPLRGMAQPVINNVAQGAAMGGQQGWDQAGGLSGTNAFGDTPTGNLANNALDTATFVPRAAWNIGNQFVSGVGQAVSGAANVLGNTFTGNADASNAGMHDFFHGVSQAFTSPMSAFNELPGYAKGPMNYVTGLFSGGIDTAVKEGLNAVGNATGQGNYGDSQAGQNARSTVMDSIGMLMAAAGGNEAGLSLLKKQPMLLNATIGQIPGGKQLAGMNQGLADATVNATNLPSTVGTMAGNFAQDTLGVENSWATPYLQRYDPTGVARSLATANTGGFYDGQGAEITKTVAPTVLSQPLPEGANPSQMMSYASDFMKNQDAINEGMVTSLAGTPALRDATVKILSDAANGMDHPGNQGEFASMLKDFTKSIGTDGTYGSLHNMYTQIGDMLQKDNSPLLGQEGFAVKLQNALRTDMSATVKAVSPSAGGALTGLEQLHGNVQSQLGDLIQSKIAEGQMQGMTPDDALLNAVPKQTNVFQNLDQATQDSLQKTIIQRVIGEQMQPGGILDYKGIVDNATAVLKDNRNLMTDNTNFVVKWMKSMAEQGAAKSVDPAKLAQSMASNPSAENMRQVQLKLGQAVTPQDLVMVQNAAKDPQLMQDIVDQANIARDNINKRSGQILPESKAGERLNTVMTTLKDELKPMGEQQDSLVATYGKEKLNIPPAKEAVNQYLEDRFGVTENKGNLNFKNSDFVNSSTTQTSIENLYSILNKKSPTFKEVNQAINTMNTDITRASTVEGVALKPLQEIGGVVKEELYKAINEKVPGFQELNQQMAKIYTATDPVFKALKLSKNIKEYNLEDAASMKSGSYLNGLAKANQGKVLETISPALQLYDNLKGTNSLSDIRTLVDHGYILKDMLGSPQAGDFQNGIKAGVSGAMKKAAGFLPYGEQAASGIEALGKMGKDPLEVNMNNMNFYQAYLKALLEKSKAAK